MGKTRRRKKKGRHSLLLLFTSIILLLVYRLSPKVLEDDTKTAPSRSGDIAQNERTPSVTKETNPTIPEDVSGQDFDAAKKELRKLFGRGSDAYCGCRYDLERRPQVDASSCGLTARGERARRIEWEHVVPASHFGRQFVSWREGAPNCPRNGKRARGRECARQSDAGFRIMEGDMYNLVPAVGELNRVRSDYVFGLIAGEPREFGACDFERLGEVIEPRPEVRGDFARIYFYMDARYPGFGLVHDGNRALLEDWDREDPMDDTERLRVQKIQSVQGNSFYIGRLSALAGKQTKL